MLKVVLVFVKPFWRVMTAVFRPKMVMTAVFRLRKRGKTMLPLASRLIIINKIL